MAFLDQIYIIMCSNTYSYAGNIFWKVIVSSFCHHPHRKQSNHGVNSHFPVVSMLPFLARKQWQKSVVLAPRRQSRTLTYLREAWTTYGDLIWKKKVFKIHIFLGDRRESWVGMSTLLLRKSRFRSQHPHRRDHTTHSSSSGGPDHSSGLWVHLHLCAQARTYACTHTHKYNKNKSLKTLVYVGWSLTVHVCHPRTREKFCRGRRTSLGHTGRLCENFFKVSLHWAWLIHLS